MTPKFPLIPYAEALSKYGTDKPDLRNPIVMQDVSEAFRGSGFKIFAKILETPGNAVWAIPAPKGGNRAFCDRMNSWAQGEGQPGLGYIFWREGEEGGAGPLAKNIGPERTKQIADQLKLGVGDACFFVAGKPKDFVKFAGPRAQQSRRGARPDRQGPFRVLLDRRFPDVRMERGGERRSTSRTIRSRCRTCRSMNSSRSIRRTTTSFLSIKAIQYDIVCNGTELSSGAIRNHRPEVMKKAFAIAGYPEDVLEQKFGGMLHALSLGAPPHGGIAPGIDRIVMLLAGEENLREVVLFPMNQRAEDLLMGAPSEVTPKQLKELHIRLELPKK